MEGKGEVAARGGGGARDGEITRSVVDTAPLGGRGEGEKTMKRHIGEKTRSRAGKKFQPLNKSNIYHSRCVAVSAETAMLLSGRVDHIVETPPPVQGVRRSPGAQ